MSEDCFIIKHGVVYKFCFTTKFLIVCLLNLTRACAAKGYCSPSVGRSVGRSVCGYLCNHIFYRTVAAVDTKRGYVGMCNGRSAQQESGTS